MQDLTLNPSLRTKDYLAQIVKTAVEFSVTVSPPAHVHISISSGCADPVDLGTLIVGSLFICRKTESCAAKWDIVYLTATFSFYWSNPSPSAGSSSCVDPNHTGELVLFTSVESESFIWVSSFSYLSSTPTAAPTGHTVLDQRPGVSAVPSNNIRTRAPQKQGTHKTRSPNDKKYMKYMEKNQLPK